MRWRSEAHAGVGVRKELPILLIVFIVPALIALVLAWWLAHP